MNRVEKSSTDVSAAFATNRGAAKFISILETARKLYSAAGYAGFTMRALANAVGMSLGNLQHYFANKDALVVGVLEFMMDGYQSEIDQVSRGSPAGGNGEAHFQAAIELLLSRAADPDTQNVFLETWALANRDQTAAELMRRVRRREHLALLKLLKALSPDAKRKRLQQQARVIVFIIEGTMVQLARDPTNAAWRSEWVAVARRQIMLCARGHWES